MPKDGPDDDAAEHRKSTRKTSLHRMQAEENLLNLVALKIIENPDKFDIQHTQVSSHPALLIFGKSESVIEWAHAIKSLTNIDLGLTNTAASAALFLQVDGTNYALTFGHGWRYLRESKVDRQFGLEIAVRMLNPEEIKRITRLALSTKSRIDHNIVPSGQDLWSFGIREHAELIRNLVGKARTEIDIGLEYVRLRGKRKNFSLSLDCGEGIQIQLSTDGETLISDLKEISRICRETDAHKLLEPLQWVRHLKPGHDLQEVLESALSDLLTTPSISLGELSIAYPASYCNGPEIDRYRGQIGDNSIDTEELNVDQIRAATRSVHRDNLLQVLRNSKIEGFDSEGNSLGGDSSVLRWLTAEIIDPTLRYILIDGSWYEVGEKYLSHVRRVVSQAFEETPPWILPSWTSAPLNTSGKVTEKAYNTFVSNTDGRFLCLDRKLVRTRIHPRGFESCDLLGPNNELIHVKKVSSETGSAALSHLFAQGLVSAESLTDRDTWNQFIELVHEQNSTRAEKLGNRPSGLVYAIYRSDKTLTPETLFTFAQSALVSASVALAAYGIPLQISVIP